MKKLVTKLVIVAAAAALVFGTGADDSCSETGSDKATENWSQVHVGQTRATVNSLLGEPSNEQKFESQDFEGGTSKTGCTYYGTSHQVCFDDAGRVESKNSY